MAQKTLGEVLDFVKDYIPDAPQAKIVRKLNLVIEEIHEKITLPERGTFTTKAPTTTGTVSATNGQTAVTFSGSVLLTTDPLRIVQIDGDGTWYTLTRNAADTAGVLSSAFAGETGATLTYTIAYPAVSFGAGVGRVLRVWREGFDDLEIASDENAPGRAVAAATGTPMWRAPYVFDAAATPDDALREVLIPAPDDDYSFTFIGLRRPTAIATNAATSVTIALPSVFNRAVMYGTLALMWGQEDDDERSGPWEQKYLRAIHEAMATTHKGLESRHRSIYESRTWRESAWQSPPES